MLAKIPCGTREAIKRNATGSSKFVETDLIYVAIFFCTSTLVKVRDKEFPSTIIMKLTGRQLQIRCQQ